MSKKLNLGKYGIGWDIQKEKGEKSPVLKIRLLGQVLIGRY